MGAAPAMALRCRGRRRWSCEDTRSLEAVAAGPHRTCRWFARVQRCAARRTVTCSRRISGGVARPRPGCSGFARRSSRLRRDYRPAHPSPARASCAQRLRLGQSSRPCRQTAQRVIHARLRRSADHRDAGCPPRHSDATASALKRRPGTFSADVSHGSPPAKASARSRCVLLRSEPYACEGILTSGFESGRARRPCKGTRAALVALTGRPLHGPLLRASGRFAS